jgi:hypothetical protein
MICTATLIRDLHPIGYDHARHTKKAGIPKEFRLFVFQTSCLEEKFIPTKQREGENTRQLPSKT